MNEVVLVPTYQRNELLHCCLRRLRGLDGDIRIVVFPDRGWSEKTLRDICFEFEAQIIPVPEHDYYGNTYNVMEAYRWAYLNGDFFRDRKYEYVYLVEDDVMVHQDFFSWHRQMHADWPDIFCSMAWVFNQYAPITDDLLFQPWYYSVGVCFNRDVLGHIVRHANPKYYGDMHGYIRKNFPANPMTMTSVAHVEQDGLIQRVMAELKMQSVASGITKCSHLGFGGYNRGWNNYAGLFEGLRTFKECVARVEELIADEYWRKQIFGKGIVEREVGHEIPERVFRYKMQVPPDWECEFTSDLLIHQLPRRLNSVSVTSETKIVVDS